MNTNRTYSPYGHSDAPWNTLGFKGEQWDALTEHYLLGRGYRAYAPALMRFTSADRYSPFARGGLNAYAYCLGDPVNYQDPSGASPLRYFSRIFKRAEPVTREPGYTSIVGYHATERWNVSSLLGGLKTGHSLEGRRALGEGFYLGKTKDYVEPYRLKAVDGVVVAALLQEGVSLVPGHGYKRDLNGVTVILPAAYDVIKIVEQAPPGAEPVHLEPTGIFAQKKRAEIRSDRPGTTASPPERGRTRG